MTRARKKSRLKEYVEDKYDRKIIVTAVNAGSYSK